MPNNQKGYFIVLEGLEGAGKTSAKQAIIDVLQAQGIAEHDLVFTREPGGTPLAEKLRQLIKHGEGDEQVNDKAELLMLYAARIQLVDNVIKPALAQGKWVIGDRHDMSSQAYQGGGRNLSQDFMTTLKAAVLGDFKPDLTLYLDVEPSIGLARARSRGELDRIEQQALTFFEKTRERYLALVAADPNAKLIDANQPIEWVTQSVQSTLLEWLKENR